MKKLSLLLASIGAGVLLVGGTIAGALVADNADPFGVKVTPGTIGTDQTDVVTLEWGTNGKSVYEYGATSASAAIENIGNGQVVGPYYVNVKATTKSGTGSYQGTFKLSLVDNSGKTSEQNRFIDNVRVYASTTLLQGDARPTYADDKGLTAYAPHSDSTQTYLSTEFPVTAPSGTDVPIYIYVALNSVSVAVYDQISTDNISMTVDWNPKVGDMLVNPILFSTGDTTPWGDDVYCYAFYEDPTTHEIKKNHAWPGDKLESAGSNTFSYALGDAYTTVIFNDGKDVGIKQTVDLDLTGVDLKLKPKFVISGMDTTETTKYVGSWVSAETTGKEYYLVGIIGGHEDWSIPTTTDHKLTVMGTTSFLQYELIGGITLSVGDEVKVVDNNGNYYPGGDNWKVTQGIIGEGTSAKFNIYFAPNGDAPGGEGWDSNTLCLVKAAS